jgi:hypothetical protein
VHKTGTAFTKPVDPIMGQAIAASESIRPAQPAVLDGKTNERVHLLFSYQAQGIGRQYLNLRVIPALCAKAGFPTADVSQLSVRTAMTVINSTAGKPWWVV